MQARPALLAGAIRIFDCAHCHAELRQPLHMRPEASPESSIQACEPCKTSPFQCNTCGDGVCEKHIETLEKYQGLFSDELWRSLAETYADQVYCGPCFRNVLEQVRQTQLRREKTKPSLFNWPLILIMLVLVGVLAMSSRQCSAPRANVQQVEP